MGDAMMLMRKMMIMRLVQSSSVYSLCMISCLE